MHRRGGESKERGEREYILCRDCGSIKATVFLLLFFLPLVFTIAYYSIVNHSIERSHVSDDFLT